MKRFLLTIICAAFLANTCLSQSRTSPSGAAPKSSNESNESNDWWKHAVIYEIYPRSFGDTKGNGLGDLNGITKHLDYLHDLGVDAIWISPAYPSPQVDFGYDISDYVNIAPEYGTLADFDHLVAEARKRNIRVIMDLVLNHTSDKHKWFLESKSSRTNPKRDWYMWHDGKAAGGSQPPNNWQSVFAHSAWQWDAKTRQFYYHMFYKEQPDLNWRNPKVRNAMYDVARFWMDRGVAGFRLDAITTLFEDPSQHDDPVKPGVNEFGDPNIDHKYTDNLPEVHDVLRELRAVINEYPGRVLIGETYLPNVQELAKMYGARNDELQLPMDTQVGFINTLSVPEFRQKIKDAETQLNGNMPLFVFDNHDNRRSWDRYGDGHNNNSIARVIAALLLAPRDTALLFQGEELGMRNTDPQRREDVKDPIGRTGWPKEKGRDGERTPMQWNAGKNAGFSSGPSTWLPVAPSYKQVNVAAEERDPGSILNFYKTLIRLRRQNAALRDGDFVMLNENDNHVLSFLRHTSDGKAVLVALNFTPDPRKISFDLKPQGIAATGTQTLLSSFAKTGETGDISNLSLPAYGVYIAEVR